MMQRIFVVAGLGLAALSLAACSPSAVALDAAALDGAIAKDLTDIKAFRADPSPANAEVLVADGATLRADIAKLRADLGATAAPAKVAKALGDAEKFADAMAKSTASAELVAAADAAIGDEREIRAGL